MKRNLICGAVLAVIFSASAGAQTCGSPVMTWHPDVAGSPTLPGSTCGNETGILSLCELAQDAHSQAYVAQITPQALGTFTTISIGNVVGFTAYMALVDTTAATPCNGGGDTGHCTTSGDDATPITHAALVDGHSYYLIVSNSGVADTNTSCGTFVLTANGTLPVTLQNFTVS